MKNLMVLAVAAIIMSLFLSSCSESVDSDMSNDYKQKTPPPALHEKHRADIVKVGVDHNGYLDYMRVKLDRIQEKLDPVPEEELFPYLVSEARVYAEEYDYDLTYIDEKFDFSGVHDLDDQTLSKLAISFEYSGEAIEILSSLETAIDDFATSGYLLNYNADCDDLLNSALNLKSEIEAVCCGVTISVAKNSGAYWLNNWEAFMDEALHRNTGGKLALSSNQKQILGADAVGALGGAKWGATAGSVGGVAGAIIGGVAGGVMSGGITSMLAGVKIAVKKRYPRWKDWF